ncbi:MAG: 4Fe-4S dicluster domain-containing protein [Candidatus Paceibacterota bacterium]|jgi:formate hydrogenlyase subunit 6/NADH:ubiquinone oxidoreductase subunit I|nr:4Fe-4S dicluster domain-containing protein [Candidatus Paceibacterota bacterium]
MKKESCFIIRREVLFDWVETLMKEEKILAPVETDDGKFAFEFLNKAEEIRLNYDTTNLPPTQKIFMPQDEKVITWKKVDGKTVFGPGDGPTPMVVFGMHPYDIHAIKVWDDVMGEKRNALADPQYLAQREVTAVIGLDVIVPPPNSFCESLGTHIATENYDIMLTDLFDGRYFVEVATHRGMSLFLSVSDFDDATPNDHKLRRLVREEIATRYPETLPVPIGELHEFLEKRIHHPYFDVTGELCVACAKCTFVCPTCTCCNIKEEPALDGQSGCRVRECDSCQLPGFTKMAGGVIARKSPGARVRHRILDKFDYHHGCAASCVGCGRCVRACPADIADPIKALNLLRDEEVPHE